MIHSQYNLHLQWLFMIIITFLYYRLQYYKTLSVVILHLNNKLECFVKIGHFHSKLIFVRKVSLHKQCYTQVQDYKPCLQLLGEHTVRQIGTLPNPFFRSALPAKRFLIRILWFGQMELDHPHLVSLVLPLPEYEFGKVIILQTWYL